jgi:hypothetical protein
LCVAANVEKREEVPADREPLFVVAIVFGGMRHVLVMALSANPPIPQQTTRKLWAMIADVVGVNPGPNKA